jgi:hypothetical protein
MALRSDRALFGSPDSTAVASDSSQSRPLPGRADDLAVLGQAPRDLDGIGRGEPPTCASLPRLTVVKGASYVSLS